MVNDAPVGASCIMGLESSLQDVGEDGGEVGGQTSGGLGWSLQ